MTIQLLVVLRVINLWRSFELNFVAIFLHVEECNLKLLGHLFNIVCLSRKDQHLLLRKANIIIFGADIFGYVFSLRNPFNCISHISAGLDRRDVDICEIN